MRDYTKIKAYELAEDLIVEIYKITKIFPSDEKFGLISQLRRAAISVAANIAEGASRQHKRDYLNFLFISRGSLAEIKCLLSLSKKLGYLNEKEHEKLNLLRENVSKTLYGLIKSVSLEVG